MCYQSRFAGYRVRASPPLEFTTACPPPTLRNCQQCSASRPLHDSAVPRVPLPHHACAARLVPVRIVHDGELLSLGDAAPRVASVCLGDHEADREDAARDADSRPHPVHPVVCPRSSDQGGTKRPGRVHRRARHRGTDQIAGQIGQAEESGLFLLRILSESGPEIRTRPASGSTSAWPQRRPCHHDVPLVSTVAPICELAASGIARTRIIDASVHPKTERPRT